PGAIGTATLDAKYMTEKVVVTQGATTTEFTYSDYKDWNSALNKIEVFYAGRLIEKKNGAVVRDLTTAQTETGNVYWVAPVPRRIYQTENDVTFLYGQFADAGGGLAEFRVARIGNQHGPDAKYANTYYGDTVGSWDGDTLVLDSIGFVDTTWIGRGGYFHSDK